MTPQSLSLIEGLPPQSPSAGRPGGGRGRGTRTPVGRGAELPGAQRPLRPRDDGTAHVRASQPRTAAPRGDGRVPCCRPHAPSGTRTVLPGRACPRGSVRRETDRPAWASARGRPRGKSPRSPRGALDPEGTASGPPDGALRGTGGLRDVLLLRRKRTARILATALFAIARTCKNRRRPSAGDG